MTSCPSEVRSCSITCGDHELRRRDGRPATHHWTKKSKPLVLSEAGMQTTLGNRTLQCLESTEESTNQMKGNQRQNRNEPLKTCDFYIQKTSRKLGLNIGNCTSICTPTLDPPKPTTKQQEHETQTNTRQLVSCWATILSAKLTFFGSLWSPHDECVHQSLPTMLLWEPVAIHFKADATPHAVHTPISEPHHWKE